LLGMASGSNIDLCITILICQYEVLIWTWWVNMKTPSTIESHMKHVCLWTWNIEIKMYVYTAQGEVHWVP
jgi:hypothetical protein